MVLGYHCCLQLPSYLWHTYCKQLTLGMVFQTGETINHVMFLDDLNLYSKSERALDTFIQIVRIFNEDNGMQFGINKCAMLVMKKRKIAK